MTPDTDPMIPISELAEALDVPPDTVTRWLNHPTPPFSCRGRASIRGVIEWLIHYPRHVDRLPMRNRKIVDWMMAEHRSEIESGANA